MIKMKYLIAIDSDGTLRHSDGSISYETKKVINELINRGNVVVLCTARPRYHALNISDEVGIKDYLISSNGTEIYDYINDEVLYGYYLPKYVIKKIYEDSKKYNIRVVFVCDNKEYVSMFTRNDYQILLSDDNVSELVNSKIKQIMIIGEDKTKILDYKKRIINDYRLKIIDSSNPFKNEVWFSIINSKSSKGNALLKLSKYLKIPRKNIISIGNDINDLSMFDISGVSVCVNNAEEEIKKVCDIVTLSNDEDGVFKYLSTLL